MSRFARQCGLHEFFDLSAPLREDIQFSRVLRRDVQTVSLSQNGQQHYLISVLRNE